MKSNIHEKSVSPAMLTYVAACIACFTSCKMCSTHSRETTNQWQSDISSQFYLDAMRFYFPSNLNEIARGRSFLQAMEGDRVTDIGEFLNRDVCLFVHTIRNNPGFVVYPISDLLDGNHWGVLGEHTNIQINVMSTNDSDLRRKRPANPRSATVARQRIPPGSRAGASTPEGAGRRARSSSSRAGGG